MLLVLNACFLPLGNIVVNELEQVAYSEKKIEKSPWLPDDRPTAPKVGSTISECCAVKKTINFVSPHQCCGSGSESGSTGSTCFWASWIRFRIHYSDVWIRILLSPSKNSKKYLHSYCFVTSF
jgi:hypothetical protein